MLGLAWLWSTAQAHSDPLDYRLEPVAIAPATYLVAGVPEHFSRANGGNIANTGFIVTGDGVVVIDTGPSKRYGEQLRAAIGKVTAAPIARVYLTHHHPDHMFGNQAFADVPIYALADTTALARAQGEGFADNMYRLVGDWMAGTHLQLPSRDVPAQRSEVTVGGHRLQFIPQGGHTEADLAIFDATAKVLFAGNVFHRRAPATPYSDLEAWIKALEELKAVDYDHLVPAVGPVIRGKGPLDAMIDYLSWLQDHLTRAAEAGLTTAEVLELPIPEPFAQWAVAEGEYQRSVLFLYPELERQVLGVAP